MPPSMDVIVSLPFVVTHVQSEHHVDFCLSHLFPESLSFILSQRQACCPSPLPWARYSHSPEPGCAGCSSEEEGVMASWVGPSAIFPEDLKPQSPHTSVHHLVLPISTRSAHIPRPFSGNAPKPSEFPRCQGHGSAPWSATLLLGGLPEDHTPQPLPSFTDWHFPCRGNSLALWTGP